MSDERELGRGLFRARASAQARARSGPAPELMPALTARPLRTMRAFSQSTLLTCAITAVAGAQSAPSLTHAKQLFDGRNYDAAKVEYSALAKATPHDVVPELYLGKIALAQNETEGSIRHFEQCAKIDDGSSDAIDSRAQSRDVPY